MSKSRLKHSCRGEKVRWRQIKPVRVTDFFSFIVAGNDTEEPQDRVKLEEKPESNAPPIIITGT